MGKDFARDQKRESSGSWFPMTGPGGKRTSHAQREEDVRLDRAHAQQLREVGV